MTARQTYASSLASAQATLVAAINASVGAYQEKINSAGNNMVAICSGNGNATNVSTTKTATATLLTAVIADNAAAIATVDAAKATLRATGDVDIF